MALTEWRDWANLSDGPAGLIAELVLTRDIADYLRLRAVCCPWRRCSTDPHGHSGLDRRFHPRHWIMLREQISSPLSRRFINVSTGECIKLELPELRDHRLKPTHEGLLLVLRKCARIQLLNPFTRHLTELPPVTTLMHPDQCSFYLWDDDFIVRGSGVGCGSGVTSESKSFLLCIPVLRIVGIAKPGDERWTVVKYTSSNYAPTLMFLGHFYHITGNNLMVLKISADQPPRSEVVAELHSQVNLFIDSVHLVDNEGELMLVHRTNPLNSRRRYDVYCLDFAKKILFTVNSFNGRAMFMGMSFSFFVSPRVFRYISGDTIYLSFELAERIYADIEAYHLQDRSTKSANYIMSWKQKAVLWPHTIVDCLSLCDTLGMYSRD